MKRKQNLWSYAVVLISGILIGVVIGPGVLKERGNNNISAYETSSLDTTRPQVTLTYPIDKTRISPNTVLDMTATATDNVGVTKVEFHVSTVTKANPARSVYITPIYQCTDETDPYGCSWSVPSTRNVTYLIQALAYDAAGNVNASKYVEFTVR